MSGTRDHHGKHGREQQKVFMAEQGNSDVVTVTKDLIEPSARVHVSKTAAQNQYAMWFQTERLSTGTIRAATHFKF
jgi:hypothetical protein